MPSIDIEMPQLSSEGESGTLASWLVREGETVEKGDLIAELETDKSTVELESPESGTLTALLVEAGTEGVETGTPLARLETAEIPERSGASDSSGVTDVSEASNASDTPNASDISDAAGDPATALSPSSATQASPSAPRSTPLARRLASEQAVDWAQIQGSGARGRIVAADVASHLSSESSGHAAEQASTFSGDSVSATRHIAAETAAAPSVTDLSEEGEGWTSTRLSAMRKTIARRLTESKQQVPHFYLRVRVAMDEVMRVRSQLNAARAEGDAGTKISLNDFVIQAAARAMRDVPEVNVQFAGDSMRVFERVDVSVAVATPGGLVTPVVRNADRKRLSKIAAEVQALAARAREGALLPEEYQGGTLTISNLGMYGIETVYPILNPPQACILGVGAADEMPVVRSGEIVVGRVAVVTLAADHRAVDGAVGAQFLAAVRDRLEDPMGLVL